MQAIYQMDVGSADKEMAIQYVLDDDAKSATDKDRTFLRWLVDGVNAHAAQLDALMTQYVEGWRLDRIAKVDLAILRLAGFELIYERESDIATIVNEAVELAKHFSTDESGRFINGALSKLLPALTALRDAES